MDIVLGRFEGNKSRISNQAPNCATRVTFQYGLEGNMTLTRASESPQDGKKGKAGTLAEGQSLDIYQKRCALGWLRSKMTTLKNEVGQKSSRQI